MSSIIRAAVLGLVLLVIGYNADLRVLQQVAQPSAVLWMLAVQPLAVIGFLLSGLKLSILMARSPRVPVLTATKTQVLGVGANLLLPGRLSEVLKLAYLSERAAAPYAQVISAVVKDRLIELVLLGLLGISIALLTLTALPWHLVAVACVAIMALFLIGKARRAVAFAVGLLPFRKLREVLLAAFDEMTLPGRMPTVAQAFAISTIVWVLSAATFTILLVQISPKPLGLVAALSVFLASIVGAAVPALPAGIGTYEAAVALALRQHGFSWSEALSLAVVMHIGQVLVAAVWASIIAIREGTGLARLYSTAKRAVQN